MTHNLKHQNNTVNFNLSLLMNTPKVTVKATQNKKYTEKLYKNRKHLTELCIYVNYAHYIALIATIVVLK